MLTAGAAARRAIREYVGKPRHKYPEPRRREWRASRCLWCGVGLPLTTANPAPVMRHYLRHRRYPRRVAVRQLAGRRSWARRRLGLDELCRTILPGGTAYG